MDIVINPTKCSETSITASNKIAKWISSLIRIPLVDDKRTAFQHIGRKINRVYLVNGVFAFCDFRDQIKTLCDGAKEVVWIGNDYALKIPTYLKNAKNIKRIAQYSNYDNMSCHKIVDFNKLLHFDGRAKEYKKSGLFYYGAFRENRINVFKHWFSKSDFDLHVSTSTKNMGDFYKINNSIKFYQANQDIRNVINLFQSSIYLEDSIKNKKITLTPANRFYEVIGSKVLLFFDINTKQTLANAGYWDDDFSVANASEINEKLKDYDSLRTKQIKLFKNMDFKKELERDFLSVI
jgi:hypothetical protein